MTEKAIQAEVRKLPTSGRKSAELKDDGARGAGRLTFRARLSRERVITEWYAVWYKGKTSKSAKIGGYPDVSLAEARRAFTEKFAPKISAGEAPVGPRKRAQASRRDLTVRAMFEAYLKTLESRTSHRIACNILLGPADKEGKRKAGAAKRIGEKVLASDVGPAKLRPVLAAVHARSPSSASLLHSYLSAAFNFALRSPHSYHGDGGGMDWGVKFNPTTALQRDKSAVRVGMRFLTPREIRDFWAYLDAGEKTSAMIPALKLCIILGQRPGEILRMRDDAYDRTEKTHFWPDTKNGKPHLLPLPRQAIDILNALTAVDGAFFFPHTKHADRPMGLTTLGRVIEVYRKEKGVAHFTPRDLRRTWKTLTGRAGISKEARDRLQNHAKGDVSSKHYDRYDYLAEKRAAMKVWEDYLDLILSGEIDNEVAKLDEERSAA